MPNHVHVLLRVGTTPMSRIVENWKKFTAHEANKVLRRAGAFWQEDYWDVFMRDSAHEIRTRHYIETNPVNARLVGGANEWPWSSARFRDENGVLHL
jgi:putative transposase